MGFFGSGDKVQSTTNTQLGASEEAVLASGSTVDSARDDAILNDLRSSNAIQNEGGVSLGGAYNQNNLGGEYSASGGGNITINGAAGAEAIAKQFASTIAQINDSSSADKLQAQQIISTALDKVSALSESKQTDGISSLGKIALWGLGLVLAGVLIWRWNK